MNVELLGETVLHVVEHDVDVYVHDEFASIDVSHEIDAHYDVVTHDVT